MWEYFNLLQLTNLLLEQVGQLWRANANLISWYTFLDQNLWLPMNNTVVLHLNGRDQTGPGFLHDILAQPQLSSVALEVNVKMFNNVYFRGRNFATNQKLVHPPLHLPLSSPNFILSQNFGVPRPPA